MISSAGRPGRTAPAGWESPGLLCVDERVTFVIGYQPADVFDEAKRCGDLIEIDFFQYKFER